MVLVTDQLKLDSFGGIKNAWKLRCRCRARIHFDVHADIEQRSESKHSEKYHYIAVKLQRITVARGGAFDDSGCSRVTNRDLR